jgi:uncharacterized membrane protein YkgB
MITFEIFLTGLMVVSTLTGLVTEAVKKILDEHNKTYRSNTLAGIVAVVLSLLVGAGYIILASVTFNAQIVVCIVALMFLSWLCSMVGYDKVVGCLNGTKGA